MGKIDIKELKNRLDSLAVFRNVMDDGVFFTLSMCLDDPSADTYAQFVSELYLDEGKKSV